MRKRAEVPQISAQSARRRISLGSTRVSGRASTAASVSTQTRSHAAQFSRQCVIADACIDETSAYCESNHGATRRSALFWLVAAHELQCLRRNRRRRVSQMGTQRLSVERDSIPSPSHERLRIGLCRRVLPRRSFRLVGRRVRRLLDRRRAGRRRKIARRRLRRKRGRIHAAGVARTDPA